MASARIVNVTDASFEQDVVQSSLPVIVDFWAVWCGPCRQIAPILDELAEAYADRVTIAKVNVDENRAVPSNFGIRGIPTLIAFKGGEEVGRLTGFGGRESVDRFVKSVL